MTDDLANSLKHIVDEHLAHYLDAIPASTTSKFLSEKLIRSAQACYELAAQRNVIDQALFKNKVDHLASDANQFAFIDETHDDNNASRRSKA